MTMSGEVAYNSQPYYPYPDYHNSTTSNNNPLYHHHQQQNDQVNGYFGYNQDGPGFQQADHPADESLNFLQHLNYQSEWPSYDTFNPASCSTWQLPTSEQPQQPNYNYGEPSQVFTNVNSTIANQSNDPNFDEVPIAELIESVYQDQVSHVPSSSSHSQSWNQNPNFTDPGHRPSNQFNNLVSTVVDSHHHESNPYSETAVSFHLQDTTTVATPYQELGNKNLVSPNNYLVSAPGYVLSQLESSTIPDVTTQSQSLHVSPITSLSSSSDSSSTNDPASLVLQVNCFKCKMCDFISLNKSNVLSHINTSHKSNGQMLTTNNSTIPVVNESPSLLPSSSAARELNGSQGPQFLASSDITSLLNGSATKDKSSQVTSKQPVKLAPKVMPPILVLDKQTKTTTISLLPSLNPSKQPSMVTSIIIDTEVANSQSKIKSRTNHSKGALIRVEQGNKKATNKSFIKSKDGRKSLKLSSSSVKKKIKTEVGYWFHCEFKKCVAKFLSANNLQKHMDCHIPGDEIGFKCTSCTNFTSLNWSSTAGHLWREHNVDIELHKCEFCNYRSYSLSILENQHKKIHSSEKNYVCDICNKGFKNNKQLVNHRVRHSKPQVPDTNVVDTKKQECDYCFKIFKDRRALLVHTNSVHKKKRPYVCNNCGHRASSRGALRTHVRSHTGEKPFKCDECDYSTSDHNSLRRHKMRHSGERPYKCPFCDYACIQSSTYKQHLRNKHPGQIEGYMFTCLCGFKTVNSENYSSHIREHGATCGYGQHGRSDGESSSYSSTSSPATPALNGPESPDMHLARGILGVSSVKDLHSLKRPLSSSRSTSSEDDSSLSSTIECTTIQVPVQVQSLQTSSETPPLSTTDFHSDLASDFMECTSPKENPGA